jgi:hypothetical protein
MEEIHDKTLVPKPFLAATLLGHFVWICSVGVGEVLAVGGVYF